MDRVENEGVMEVVGLLLECLMNCFAQQWTVQQCDKQVEGQYVVAVLVGAAAPVFVLKVIENSLVVHWAMTTAL